MMFGDEYDSRPFPENGPIGYFVTLNDASIPEIICRIGYDFIMVDLEHTVISLQDVSHMVGKMESVGGETDFLIRLPGHDRSIIQKVLDLGVDGIMAPMVNTAEQAERIVSSYQYPPDGNRGVAGTRASKYGVDLHEQFETANEKTTFIAQIETEIAISNINSILKTDGLDAIFIGPADLSASVGDLGNYSSDEFQNHLNEALSVCLEDETPIGTLALDEDSRNYWSNFDFDYMISAIDKYQLRSSAEASLGYYEY